MSDARKLAERIERQIASGEADADGAICVLLTLDEAGLIVSAIRAPALPRWQLIASSPKDGTDILIFIPSLGWRPAYWRDARGKWVSPVFSDIEYEITEPTHWMEEPPAPPTEAGGAVETGVKE